jgi:hypothetical protein
MTANSFVPSSERNPPEIFWMRPSCSAKLFVKGTLGSVRKRRTSCLQVLRRSRRLWPTRRGGRPRRLAYQGWLRLVEYAKPAARMAS